MRDNLQDWRCSACRMRRCQQTSPDGSEVLAGAAPPTSTASDLVNPAASALREKERSAERVRANAPIEPPAARSRGGTIPRDAIVDRAARGARHARALGSQ